MVTLLPFQVLDRKFSVFVVETIIYTWSPVFQISMLMFKVHITLFRKLYFS